MSVKKTPKREYSILYEQLLGYLALPNRCTPRKYSQQYIIFILYLACIQQASELSSQGRYGTYSCDYHMTVSQVMLWSDQLLLACDHLLDPSLENTTKVCMYVHTLVVTYSRVLISAISANESKFVFAYN